MGRLRRFEQHRYVGTRDDMVVYDCDDARDFEALESRVAADSLIDHNGLQAFGPDTLSEARNRGFKPR